MRKLTPCSIRTVFSFQKLVAKCHSELWLHVDFLLQFFFTVSVSTVLTKFASILDPIFANFGLLFLFVGGLFERHLLNLSYYCFGRMIIVFGWWGDKWLHIGVKRAGLREVVLLLTRLNNILLHSLERVLLVLLALRIVWGVCLIVLDSYLTYWLLG